MRRARSWRSSRARRFAAPSRGEDVAKLRCGSTTPAPRNGGFEEGVRARARGHLGASEVPVSLRDDAGGRAARRVVRAHERRARVAALVLLVEHDPRRRAARDRGRGRARRSRRARAAGRRMLADPRSETLASNFAYQWLGLGKLASLAPDPERVRRRRPRTSASIRHGGAAVRRQRVPRGPSVLDLLTAETHVSERSARAALRLNDVRGKRFRRVELTDEARCGLARQRRACCSCRRIRIARRRCCAGQWVLEEAARHAAGVDRRRTSRRSSRTSAGEPAARVRERLEAHRTNPSCNGCHGVMDPLGFALENFDAVGRWRRAGPRGRHADRRVGRARRRHAGRWTASRCAHALLARPEQFVQTFDREANDLRARAYARATGHADGAANRPRGGARGLPVLGDRARAS